MWVSSFSYGGQMYGSNMVGTDPAAGSATTVVPVTIVPLRLTFARDGSIMDFPGMADELAASSLFTPFPFLSGTTQFLDAYRRADFWQEVTTTSPDYHTLLGGPTIAPVQRWTVPTAKGLTFVDAGTNRRFAIADGDWLSHQLDQTIGSLQIDPRSLVVFLAYNTEFTYAGTTPDGCFTSTGCSLFAGIHAATTSGNPNLGTVPPRSVNTYAYAMFEDLGDLVPAALNEHLIPVSHELLEWLDDPIAINVDPSQPFGPTLIGSTVPSWTSPFWQHGCSNSYEVADPAADGGPLIGVPNPSSGQIDLFAEPSSTPGSPAPPPRRSSASTTSPASSSTHPTPAEPATWQLRNAPQIDQLHGGGRATQTRPRRHLQPGPDESAGVHTPVHKLQTSRLYSKHSYVIRAHLSPETRRWRREAHPRRRSGSGGRRHGGDPSLRGEGQRRGCRAGPSSGA